MSKYVPIAHEYWDNTRLHFDKLIDCSGVLAVYFAALDGRGIELKFDSYLVYRKMDEGDALLVISEMKSSGGTSKFLYRVDESKFLEWFNAERCGEVLGQPLTHYSMASVDDVIDVLTFNPPVIARVE